MYSYDIGYGLVISKAIGCLYKKKKSKLYTFIYAVVREKATIITS